MALFSIWLLKPLAIRLRLIDSPGGRKQHQGDIPLIGGLAMFVGFLFALLTLNVSLSVYRSFIAASGLLVLVGVLDDFQELSAHARLVAQIIAGLLMALWGSTQLTHFGNILFFGDITLGLLSIPITVFAVVGIINAVNMTDGLDGLAGSLALVQLLLLALIAYKGHLVTDVQILCALIFSLLGFLMFNLRLPWRSHAHIFMGDSGSMFLGFSLAWFLVSLAQNTLHVARPVTMIWIMIVPLFDTTRLLISRIYQRRSPFSPDREHIHHILAEKGFNATQTILLLCFATLISGLFAIAGDHFNVPASVMFFAYIALFGGFYWWIEKLTDIKSACQA